MSLYTRISPLLLAAVAAGCGGPDRPTRLRFDAPYGAAPLSPAREHCTPCTDDGDCSGGRCYVEDEASPGVCVEPCGEQRACAAGFSCEAAWQPSGAEAAFCLPSPGTCVEPVAQESCGEDRWLPFAANFFAARCLACHPAYDSLAGVEASAAAIRATIANGSMPKDAVLTDDEKARILRWLDCRPLR